MCVLEHFFEPQCILAGRRDYRQLGDSLSGKVLLRDVLQRIIALEEEEMSGCDFGC